MLRMQAEQIDVQAELINRLQVEMGELKRQLGVHSGNSSAPPSQDSMAAKARRRADRSSRVRSADRRPGGQPDVRARV
jgi:hypothetical protein